MDLAGKNVLITGASAGIGKELALQFARHKANVALLARRVEALEEVAAECRLASGNQAKVLPLRCDVTDRASCREAVLGATNEMQTVDIIILNAGVSMGCYFEDIKDLSDADKLMDVNFMGTANVLFYALPYIPKRSDSRIVVVSSIAGLFGVPFRTFYCASKWALHGFCASLRTELLDAYGSNSPAVVLTCPGEVSTSLNSSRLKFGNDVAAEFLDSVAEPTSQAANKILEATIAGVKVGFFTKAHSWLSSCYGWIPATIDGIMIKGVRSRMRAPRYGNW
ncbi:HSD2 [Symbiodinium natans]|uniref:HSD2 protein n=1 Tax=Symbiodinium natans TaxID=878477 RepID=A0A812MXB9_9DINO|nr:HSD2 [Symbiodinium natans]